MGYYSEMRMVCREEDYDAFRERYLELAGGDDYGLLGDVCSLDGCTVISNNCKWYEGYRCVDAFERAYREVFSETERPAMFCRVGEEWEDVEVRDANDTSLLNVRCSPATSIELY